MGYMPIHLRDARPGDIADNVIVVGDPSRVELLSSVLSDVKIVNRHRGFLAVTGFYRGLRASIVCHGIGGASAAIVFEELWRLGAKRMVRLGTAGGLVKELSIGSVVVPGGAGYVCNGAGLGLYGLNYCLPSSPDPLLTKEIVEELRANGLNPYVAPVFSSDSFYAEDPELARKLSRMGFKAIEMECATLFALSWIRGFSSAAVLIISDNLVSEEKVFLTTMELRDKFERAAKAILEAFSRTHDGK